MRGERQDRRQHTSDISRRRPDRNTGNAASNKARRKRKRRLLEALGKIIPVIVALVLIVAIVGIFYGNKLIERYKYSGKYADLNEYFSITYDYHVGMIVNNVKVDDKAVFYKKNKDTIYLSVDEVKKYFTDRFYFNVDEEMAYYTTGTDIIKAPMNQADNYCYYFGDEQRSLENAPVITNDGKTYVSLEYLKIFCDFKADVYDEPKRLVLYTEETSLEKAVINKETKVRYRGGVKSDILEDMNEGDTVYVLEEMEDWAKVQTTDGFIGYVEIKRYDKKGEELVSLDASQVPLNYSPIKFDAKINMAFHQVFDKNASDFTSDIANTKGVNIVAPTWFRITDSDGTFTGIPNTNYVQNAHNAGVKVWAVWTDVDSDVDLSKTFHTYERRQNIINTMISETTANGIDGINLDMEKIPSAAGDDWGEFLKELSVATHKAGIVLSVDNYAPTASTLHYNRGIQGDVCDYVVIMGYDEHWSTSDTAGSVASIGFVEDGITNTINCGVPEEKIINAIPFYTRVWKTKDDNVTSETLSMITSTKWVQDNGFDMQWDDVTCQYYGEKEMKSTLYQIWLEENESIAAKLSVMDAHNCAGVAEWKLGLETPEVWDAIEEYLMR